MSKTKTWLILGKFMPLHKGHEMMIRFAYSFVDKLFVAIDNTPKDRYVGEYIPANYRIKWMKQIVPNAKVVYLPFETPQYPKENPDFRAIWQRLLLDVVKWSVDYFIASENYGFKLAELLWAEFVPLDIQRQVVEVSATKIRTDFLNYYDYLPVSVKNDFTLRVCIFGPESTGKSILTMRLAKYYNTVWVPEYARFLHETYFEKNPDFKLGLSDMYKIWKWQIALEDSMMINSNKILFVDTDALVTTVRSSWLFDWKVEPKLKNLVDAGKYDLYLLTYPDIWRVEDKVRYFPEQEKRIKFFDDCEMVLKQIWAKYEIIRWEGDIRINNAIKIVDDLFSKSFNYEYFINKMNR